MVAQKLSRRDFLAGAAIASSAFMAGCSKSNGEKTIAESGLDADAQQSTSPSYAPSGFIPASAGMTPMSLAELKETYRGLGAKHLHILEPVGVDRENCCAQYAFTDAIEGNPWDGNVFVVVTSKVRMPNVIGMSPTEATAALQENGLTASPSLTQHAVDPESNADEPAVVSASVQAGSLVKVGTVVELEYSGSLEGYS